MPALILLKPRRARQLRALPPAAIRAALRKRTLIDAVTGQKGHGVFEVEMPKNSALLLLPG